MERNLVLGEPDRKQIPNETFLLESKLHLHELPFEDKLKEIMISEILKEKIEKKNLKLDEMTQKVYWRVEKGDDMKRKIVSNSRIVEWENGTYGIYIGDEYYDLLSKPNMSDFIFGETSENSNLLTKKSNPSLTLNLKPKIK